MQSVREACVPRAEVLKGDLEDALFAADFGHVVAGIAPDVYKDPVTFFRNTYPATALKKVVKTIFQRLADPNEAGGVFMSPSSNCYETAIATGSQTRVQQVAVPDADKAQAGVARCLLSSEGLP